MGADMSIPNKINNRLFPPNRPMVDFAMDVKRLNSSSNLVYLDLLVKEGPDPLVVVITHGNMETMSSGINEAKKAFDQVIAQTPDAFSSGLRLVAWEYAGYGARGGEEPSRSSIAADAREMAKAFAKDRVVFLGRSLGGYGAMVGALEHQRLGGRQKIFLLSAFASIMHVQPSLFLLRGTFLDGLENYKLARQYKGEAWIVHGNNDTVVNVKNAEVLRRNFSNSRVHIMDNFSHNGLWPYLFQNTSLVNVFK